MQLLALGVVFRKLPPFLRQLPSFGDIPSAELGVWACIVPPGTMQHPVLLGRDIWMRFEQRTYTTLPPQPPQPTCGELSLCTLFRRSFHLCPGRPTTGRRVPSPIRRPRSGLAHVYTFARPGQLSTIFGHANPHRKLPCRHAPPRQPFLRPRNLRRPRTPPHTTLRLYRPGARRPFRRIISSVNSDVTFLPPIPFHRAPTDALRYPRPTRQHPCGHRRILSH